MGNPKVTVLMPVYNGEIYLAEAIESILNQTFADFEFLIIDDGSTDNTWGILSSYNDNRIRLTRNPKNVGLIESLNNALTLAIGHYIARIDADDISLPKRLEKQKEFLDKNLEIALVGSWVEIIDRQGKRIGYQKFLWDDSLIRWQLLFKTTFAHSAIMARRDVLTAV